MSFAKRIGAAFHTRAGAYIFFALAAAALTFLHSAKWAYGWIAELYPLGSAFVPLVFCLIGLCVLSTLGFLIAAALKPEAVGKNRAFRGFQTAVCVLTGVLFGYTAVLLFGLDKGFIPAEMSKGLWFLVPNLPYPAFFIVPPIAPAIFRKQPKKAFTAFVVLFAAAAIATPVFYISGKPMSIQSPEDKPPELSRAFLNQEAAENAGGGWFVTIDEDFDGDTLSREWAPSPHGLRNKEYWCDNMLEIGGGTVKVYAAALEDNECDICPAKGEFTSGIETRLLEDGRGYEQAFGYYECRVKIPNTTGLWSAFWLQSTSMGRVGDKGRDGSEIDIYESAFPFSPTSVGNAILWDGYAERAGVLGNITDSGIDLYDGDWHTYSLLWTPKYYVFFVDGTATWKTNAGGVSKVPEFIRLTVEIRRGETGPYGSPLGEFKGTKENPDVFEIDYVKVYQHTDFLEHIKSPDDF